MKKFITLLLIFCMLLGLTGCTASENEFLNLLYGKEYKSFTTTGTMETELNSKVPAEVKDALKPFNIGSLCNALSDFKLAWGENTYFDGEDFRSKATFGVSSPDSSFVTNAYMLGDNKDMLVGFDIPSLYKAFLPEKYENATAAYCRLSEMNDISEEMIDFNYAEFMKTAKELNGELQECILSFSKYVPEIKPFIKKSGLTYTVSISDEELKTIIDAVGSAYLDDERARFAANKLLNKIFDMYRAMYTEEGFEEAFGSIYRQINSVDEEEFFIAYNAFKDFTKKLKNVRLLGDGGIKLTYKFGLGYIKSLRGSIDFMLDLKNISKEISGKEYSEDFYVNGVIKINQTYSNINKLKISDIPAFDPQNAVSVDDWTKAYQSDIYAPEYDFENGNYLLTKNSAPSENDEFFVMDYDYAYLNTRGLGNKIIGSTLYSPLEPLADLHFSEYYWDNEQKEMILDGFYHIKPSDDIIECNNYKIALNAPVLAIDGYLYVPLDSFEASVFGNEVYFSEELNTAFIGGEFYYDIYMGDMQ